MKNTVILTVRVKPLLTINPSLGMYQEIQTYLAMRIYSVKINNSLPMMRKWLVMTYCSEYWVKRSPLPTVGEAGMRKHSKEQMVQLTGEDYQMMGGGKILKAM